MKNLAVSGTTIKSLELYKASPSHALALVGPGGAGKYTLAVDLAESILGIYDFKAYPYALLIQSEDGKSIGIELIRQAASLLTLKVPMNREVNRVIIVKDAQLMGIESQNSLLKMLEEPPQGTIFIMTLTSETAILPTVSSRLNLINVDRVSKEDLRSVFSGHDEADFVQAYNISGGLPGLMYDLLNNEDHHLLKAVETARQVISKSQYERLLIVDELSKQRQLSLDLSYVFQQMAHVSLQNDKLKNQQQWVRILKASYSAEQDLRANVQPKLVLDKLMLEL